MMIDRLLVSDIKEEIAQMQYEISAAYAPPVPPPPQLITTPTGFDATKIVNSPLQQLKIDPSAPSSPQFSPRARPHNHHLLVKTPTMSPHLHHSPRSLPPSPSSKMAPSPKSLPSCMHSYPVVVKCCDTAKKESATSELKRFKRNKATVAVQPAAAEATSKKIAEDFDIESELTPNFIMKKCDTSNQDDDDEQLDDDETSVEQEDDDNEDESPEQPELIDDYFAGSSEEVPDAKVRIWFSGVFKSVSSFD